MIAIGGEALIDAHQVDNILRPLPGGGPFNTAGYPARLQVPTCLVAGVSRHPLGEQRQLSEPGVNVAYLSRTEAPTRMAVVDPSVNDARYSFYLSAAAHRTLDSRRAGEAFGAGLVAALPCAATVGALQCTQASAWAPSLSDVPAFHGTVPRTPRPRPTARKRARNGSH